MRSVSSANCCGRLQPSLRRTGSKRSARWSWTVGELSLVIPEYVQELYPPVVKGSILEHAELRVNIVPGLAECEECDEIFNVIEHKGYCPICGSFEKTVLSGKEFTVREIVVPENITG